MWQKSKQNDAQLFPLWKTIHTMCTLKSDPRSVIKTELWILLSKLKPVWMITLGLKCHSVLTTPPRLPSLTPNWTRQTASPPWAWFCRMFLLFKREFFLPTAAHVLAHRGSSACWGFLCFLYISVASLPYSIKHLESTVVVKKINWTDHMRKKYFLLTTFKTQK